MQSKRLQYMNELMHALGSYASQVQLSAKEGLTDSAKDAENTLIDIVNLAYGSKFINLNSQKIDHPGIDWIETQYRTGLQVTVTEDESKISDSIDTLIRHNVETSKEIWFLVITTSRHGGHRKHGKYRAQTITINDVLRQISALPDDAFFLTVEKAKEKLSGWFNHNRPMRLEVNLPKLISKSPTEFINHHNLWSHFDEVKDVSPATIKKLNNFIESYTALPPPAREAITKIVHYAPIQENLMKPLKVELTEFYYHLSNAERDELEDLLLIIEKNSHGHLQASNSRVADDGLTLNHDHHIELTWMSCEPDMNIYTALKSFYLTRYNAAKLLKAFQEADFTDLEES